MSDIHPENLLEKFAEGGLTPNEHHLLQEHLAGCVACRFELVVRADLEIEADALEFDQVALSSTSQLSALRVSASELDALRARAHVGDGEQQLTRVGAPVSIRRRSWRRVVAITAAALGLASGAAALVGTQLPSTPTHALDVTRAQGGSIGRSGSVERGGSVGRGASNTPDAPRPPAESDTKAPEAAALPAAVRAAAPARERKTPTSSPADVSRGQADETLTAAQLFSDANQARRASDSGRATQLYRLLQRKFPGSQEAQLSLVTLGSLQLNGGNAAGALATFNRYLNGGGRSLEAEALYGQAQALRRLGRIGEERRVWERLLARHPGSGYAPQARERLDSLGGS